MKPSRVSLPFTGIFKKTGLLLLGILLAIIAVGQVSDSNSQASLSTQEHGFPINKKAIKKIFIIKTII